MRAGWASTHSLAGHSRGGQISVQGRIKRETTRGSSVGHGQIFSMNHDRNYSTCVFCSSKHAFKSLFVLFLRLFVQRASECWQQGKVKSDIIWKWKLNITLTRSMDKRSAKNFITESVVTAASTNFSLCMAMFTQAHTTVEGWNTKNLHSEDRRGRLL